MEQVSILNIKVKVEVLLQDRLEKIRNGEILLKVYNQHDEHVIEDALKNFDRFDAQAEKWLKEGVNLTNTDPMVWAHQLMERKHGNK